MLSDSLNWQLVGPLARPTGLDRGVFNFEHACEGGKILIMEAHKEMAVNKMLSLINFLCAPLPASSDHKKMKEWHDSAKSQWDCAKVCLRDVPPPFLAFISL